MKYLLITVKERETSVTVCPTMEKAQEAMYEAAKQEYMEHNNGTEDEWNAIMKSLEENGTYADYDFWMGPRTAWSSLNGNENMDWSIFALPEDQTTGAIHYAEN